MKTDAYWYKTVTFGNKVKVVADGTFDLRAWGIGIVIGVTKSDLNLDVVLGPAGISLWAYRLDADDDA